MRLVYCSTLIALTCSTTIPALAQSKKCLHVASYESDNDWSSKIDETLREKLAGSCRVESFYMGTKRNPDLEFARKKGLEAKALVEKSGADLLIVSDDNAIKHLVVPHYKNAKQPVVFLGVNWTIKPYEMPFKNTTGVIEVAPIDAIIYEVKKALPSVRSVAFITVDTETERKEHPFIVERFKAAGLGVKEYWPKTFAEWKKLYVEAQEENDFVYLGNKMGAKDWNDSEAVEWAKKHQKKLGGSTYDWMWNVASFVMAKSAREQGELGAEIAKQVLAGKDPSKIPVTGNKLYDARVNKELLEKSGVRLSEGFMRRAAAK